MPTQDSSRGGPSHLTMRLKNRWARCKGATQTSPPFPFFCRVPTRYAAPHYSQQKARSTPAPPARRQEESVAVPGTALKDAASGRSPADRSHAMEPTAAKQSRTTLLCLRHEHAQPDACQRRAWPPLCAACKVGGDKRYGHSLERPLRERFGGSKWVSIAICLPGITISSR
ncbi:hypothetical protein D3C72_1569530 [compost metagenome]